MTGSAICSANEWELACDNWTAKLAGSIAGPIFDAGRRRAEVERPRAVVDERLAVCKQTIVTAVQEVENALIREAKQREYVDALKVRLGTAQDSHREARARYQKGLSDYLPVLSALTTAQSLERSLVQANHDLLAQRVQLYLALGGSWMERELIESEV